MHALDNLCNPSGSVVAGSREFLHAGRIHPHPACDRAGRTSSSIDFRPQAHRLTVLQEPVRSECKPKNRHNCVPRQQKSLKPHGREENGNGRVPLEAVGLRSMPATI